MIFQEYDCPLTGIDRDLHDDQIVIAGESFYCHLCWENHVAGRDVDMQTTIVTRGAIEVRPLPVDDAQKTAWLLEARKL